MPGEASFLPLLLTGASASKAAQPVTQPGGDFITHSKTRPDLAALSVGLPTGWRAMWDAATGDIYYGSLDQQEVSWQRP